MQIISIIGEENKNITPQESDEKVSFIKNNLLELFKKLKKDGYKFDTRIREFQVVNYSNYGLTISNSEDLTEDQIQKYVDAIFKYDQKMMIIYMDSKHVSIENKFFTAMCFTHERKVHPLSVYDILSNYDSLFIKQDQKLLDKLYFNKFVEKFGESQEAIPHLFKIR